MNTTFLVAEICNDKGLLAVYCNPSKTDYFLVGIPLKATEGFLLLYLLSTDMQFDGVCLCSIESIYRVEKESIYLRKFPNCVPKDMRIIKDPWHDLLSCAERKKLAVKITRNTDDSVVYGIPLRHTRKSVTLSIVNHEGETAENIAVDCNDVATLICEGMDLQSN